MIEWIVAATASSAAVLLAWRATRLYAEVRKIRSDFSAAEERLRERCAAIERDAARVRAECDALRERCGSGVLVLDSAGVIRGANTLSRRFFDAPVSTLTGSTLLQATLSDELDNLFRAARASACLVRSEIRVGAASPFSLVVSVSPLPAQDGEPLSFLLVAQNVTELRRLETVRRDFVANVSHELRTPLASIRAMAETLQDGALQDAAVSQRFLGTIVAETQRLTRIAEDLLVLSDAESHRPEKRVVSLSDMVIEIVGRFRPQAEKAGILLTADVPAGLDVSANADQMEQVILNLVDNAIKYTPSGGRVEVTGEKRKSDVAIHVTDTGIGIMRQDVPRIFERFYRVDKARSRQSGGTGLGLSIVKHIVESHGGHVAVESEFNHGSTFSFLVPTDAREHPRATGALDEALGQTALAFADHVDRGESLHSAVS